MKPSLASQDIVPGAPPEPPGDAPPPARAAWLLRVQARACQVMGSPLYGALLDRAADDAASGGATFDLVAPSLDVASGDRRSSALALRLMAAAHRMVLLGEAPELAAHYPSAGGDADPDGAWRALHRLFSARRARLEELVAAPCQTNEVGRAAGLAVAFLEAAARYPLPLRLLEIGASAGLNLRWDRFRYGGGGAAWGDPTSPVDLRGLWSVPPAHTDVAVTVRERAGCDLTPLDPASPHARIVLGASLWADQRERFERLDGALALAARIPAELEAASADAWVAQRLGRPAPGTLTVVYHSVVEEYLPGEVRARFHAALREAGERASDEAPLAWARLEPVSALRQHGVTLTVWPGGDERVVARCGAHGQDTQALSP